MVGAYCDVLSDTIVVVACQLLVCEEWVAGNDGRVPDETVLHSLILWVQVQLAEKDGQLLEMAAQVEAASTRGRHHPSARYPRSTSSSPYKAPSSAAWPSPAPSVGRTRPSRPFADVTNCESSSSRVGASPDKQVLTNFNRPFFVVVSDRI